ncbi:substrate-binding periplasmic protein [Chitinimonas sp.]|uniref:substrate-binding periplasmic protein n=1 Tax=Chitinimonas sp. TaxID=1934313 RepID=UPI0035B3D99C
MSTPLLRPMLLSLVLLPCWAGSYVVGVESTDYLPIYKGDSGAYSGYAHDLLDAFAAKHGHQFTYKPMPIARLFDEFARQKTLDFKFPDNPMWQPDIKKGVNISYSKGAIIVTEGLLVLPANKGKPLAAIKSIATLRGFTPWPYKAQIDSGAIKLTEANSADAAIQMGESGRADGVFLNTTSAAYIMSEVRKKPGALVLDDKLPLEKSEFSLSSIAHPEVIKAFNEFLDKERDTVAKLKAKYKISD